MNELKQPTKTIFETVTEHRGRSLKEQRDRHEQATSHTRYGKLQVREDKNTKRIIVFQECLDCKKETK